MNLNKKRVGIATAALAVAGVTAAGAGSAFADSSKPTASGTTATTASATTAAYSTTAQATTGSSTTAQATTGSSTTTGSTNWSGTGHHHGRNPSWGFPGRGGARLFLKGGHGENTVKDQKGTWVTRDWQVGTVTSISGQNLTVKGADGTTWTWTDGSTTKVRAMGKAGTLSDVKVGDEILVAGTLNGTAHDAMVIVDPGKAQIQKWEQAQTNRASQNAKPKWGGTSQGSTTNSDSSGGSQS